MHRDCDGGPPETPAKADGRLIEVAHVRRALGGLDGDGDRCGWTTRRTITDTVREVVCTGEPSIRRVRDLRRICIRQSRAAGYIADSTQRAIGWRSRDRECELARFHVRSPPPDGYRGVALGGDAPGGGRGRGVAAG